MRATVNTRDTDAELRRFWDAVARRFVEATAAQIERERAAGLARPGPPAALPLASVLVGMNERAFHEATLHRPSAAADRELVDTLTHVWLVTVYLPDARG